MARRRAVIQRIGHAVIVRTAPLRVEGLGCRIHGREAANRHTGESSVVVPTLEGVARAQRVCHRNRARQGLYRIARQIDRRVGRRMARVIIQHIVDRITLRRTPLCVVVLIFRIHGVQRANRCARKARIIVPAEEVITCPRRSCDCEIRLGNIVAELRVRVRRRVSGRRRVIQMIGDTVGIRCAPSRIVVLILRVHGVKRRDRRSRERGIVIPALKVITGARCGAQSDIRIQNGIACDRIRIACRMARRRTVV